jgi:murein L,D-transpeptidase YcbB/YkuD
LQEEAIPIYIVYLTARMTPAGLTIYPNVYAQDKS